MQFVETPVFTAALRRHLDDEPYRQLQIALMLRPEQGSVIRTRRGSVLHAVRVHEVGTGDLTAAQTRQLGRIVREEFK